MYIDKIPSYNTKGLEQFFESKEIYFNNDNCSEVYSTFKFFKILVEYFDEIYNDSIDFLDKWTVLHLNVHKSIKLNKNRNIFLSELDEMNDKIIEKAIILDDADNIEWLKGVFDNTWIEAKNTFDSISEGLTDVDINEIDIYRANHLTKILVITMVNYCLFALAARGRELQMKGNTVIKRIHLDSNSSSEEFNNEINLN